MSLPNRENPEAPTEGHLYDITTVCRLTGLTSANLRVWEKRYQAVSPARSSSGRRQYSREDLQRLTLLKTLAELGHSISTSAGLPIEELERRIREASLPGKPSLRGSGEFSRHLCRVGVVGERLRDLISGNPSYQQRALAAVEYPDLAAAERSDFPVLIDLILAKCPALFVEDVSRIRKLLEKSGASRAVVVFGFTQQRVLEMLGGDFSRIILIRAPISPSDLMEVLDQELTLANRPASDSLPDAPESPNSSEGSPPRRFSEIQLATISRLSTSIE